MKYWPDEESLKPQRVGSSWVVPVVVWLSQLEMPVRNYVMSVYGKARQREDLRLKSSLGLEEGEARDCIPYVRPSMAFLACAN